MSDPVVITGVGVVSPIGATQESFWRGALEGRSGVIRLDNPWVTDTDLRTKIGAPVRGFDPIASGIPRRDVTLLDRTTWFAVAAAREAARDAGYDLLENPDVRGAERIDGVEPERLATVIGTGIGGFTTLESAHASWREARTTLVQKRYGLPMLIPNAPAAQVAIRLGARGECKAVTTACAAGTMAIGDAFRLVRDGDADVALAGGAEGLADDHDAFAMLGFERLRTLSVRNDEPHRASRPFDRDRDGFVLGEGAAVLLLERESHARARGVVPYARVLSYATNCDATSMMQLDETGDTIVAMIRSALDRAGLDPSAVDHVSAHGTSTIPNDRTEALVLRRLLGARVERVSVTALKSMTGHAIGASGPLETAALALAFRAGVIAPTINYENPDPDCAVDIVANTPRAQRPNVALKLSYGFGGHNACLVLGSV